MKNVFLSVAGSIGLFLFASSCQTVESVGPKENIAIDLGGGVTMEFVLIRPGVFVMGQGDKGDDRPAHEVNISKPFYLGKYEVTQAQWEKLMGANPSHFKGAKNPVETVSWNDCQYLVAQLKEKVPGRTFRLPTEAEWEYACRAGTTTEYGFGDTEASLGDYAWYTGNSGSTTHAVGEKKPNARGLFDMHGNVCEWCAETNIVFVAPDYPGAPSSVLIGVVRGGSWLQNAASCRSANRLTRGPMLRDNFMGLRLVVVPR